MIALIQRVSQASVTVAGQTIAHIDAGLLALIGIEHGDGHAQANKLLNRLINYRIFSDGNGKMNCSLQDISGGLLLVPQFTLAADTQSGLRPSFSSAAPPEQGAIHFHYLCQQARQQYHTVQTGQFGADMQVSLTNEGPVTFWLQVPPHNERCKQ